MGGAVPNKLLMDPSGNAGGSVNVACQNFTEFGRALRLEQEKEVLWLEDHDSLTGALSLAGFRKKVEELLRSHPDIPYLLAYVNIKNFKFVNDSLGMKAGDEPYAGSRVIMWRCCVMPVEKKNCTGMIRK